MMNLVQSVRKLVWWKQLVVLLMLILIVLTWSAVCIILGSYLVP
jgi:hypothetical protein